LLKKILFLLSPSEKRWGVLVLAMVTVMAGLEVAGVLSVMPFLSVLGNPEIVRENPVLARVFEAFGFGSVDTFLIALGVASFLLILFSAAFGSITHYVMNRFIEMRRHSIGERLLETYLRQPYAFFLDRHSSDLAKTILSEADQLVVNVLRPGVMLIAHGLVAAAMVILLFVVDPALAAGVVAVVGGLYILIYLAVRQVLARVGRDRVTANRERFTTAGEALGGIKDIKLLGRENTYVKAFRGPSKRQAKHQATSQTLSAVPRFLVEAVGFGGIIALTLVLITLKGGASSNALGETLPFLGLYAFAGYRLLPAAQQIYQGVAKLRFGAAVVDNVHSDLIKRSSLAAINNPCPEPFPPQQEIAFSGVSFTYPNASIPALTNINLAIPVGSSVGLVGGTGAGKTTMVDLLLGLLTPTEGVITVDGRAILDDHRRAWQGALGYVPQDIFLTDSSVAENIALGVPPHEIDQEQVKRCARMAQLDDFIRSEMPDGYDTIVGERGVRLSGGQCQRIGIARALYRDPPVLVFDEATSALDNMTESAVMDAIKYFHNEKTIIIIAHRLTTVQGCDKVVFLNEGVVEGEGSYNYLKKSNEKFRAMAASVGF